MKFSTKATYGIRAIIRLAQNWEQGNLSLATIASEENISLGYLEKIFSKLKNKKIVVAEKGTTGGYCLSKKPSEINILEIINALEGDQDIFHCLDEKGKKYCSIKCHCDANSYLVKIQGELSKTLEKIKLSELIK